MKNARLPVVSRDSSKALYGCRASCVRSEPTGTIELGLCLDIARNRLDSTWAPESNLETARKGWDAACERSLL
jgi:hypothetical protein